MTPLRRSVCWLLLVVLLSVLAFIAAAPADTTSITPTTYFSGPGDLTEVTP